MKITKLHFPGFIILMLLFSCKPAAKKNNMVTEENNPQFKEITLCNKEGTQIKVINFGATITSILLKDKNGQKGEIVLGYNESASYPEGNPYFGAAIGRYGNRIAKGKFALDGKEYQLATNNGSNHLHGGKVGFNNVFWDITNYKDQGENQFVEFRYISKDGEEGYPGTLKVNMKYTLTESNELIIEYEAETDKPTIVNLTHHSFFNLKDGGKSNIIMGHQLKINANAFTPVDSTLIPTGEIRTVENTPFDFRKMKSIGRDIQTENTQLKYGKGYDHNFVLKESQDSLKLAAIVFEPKTGRKMEIFTTEPGLQFYSGNFLDASDIGHDSTAYQFRTAICLEPQHFPDSPNHNNFPSTVLRPGEVYKQKSVYRFTVED